MWFFGRHPANDDHLGAWIVSGGIKDRALFRGGNTTRSGKLVGVNIHACRCVICTLLLVPCLEITAIAAKRNFQTNRLSSPALNSWPGIFDRNSLCGCWVVFYPIQISHAQGGSFQDRSLGQENSLAPEPHQNGI